MDLITLPCRSLKSQLLHLLIILISNFGKAYHRVCSSAASHSRLQFVHGANYIFKPTIIILVSLIHYIIPPDYFPILCRLFNRCWLEVCSHPIVGSGVRIRSLRRLSFYHRWGGGKRVFYITTYCHCQHIDFCFYRRRHLFVFSNGMLAMEASGDHPENGTSTLHYKL